MGPSYKTNDPRGWGGDPSRGAALGRGTIHDTDRDVSVKLYLRRVRINSGGYDPNGTYFGIGEPLWWYADAEGDVDACLRASTREDAKRKIRATYPAARFFR